VLAGRAGQCRTEQESAGECLTVLRYIAGYSGCKKLQDRAGLCRTLRILQDSKGQVGQDSARLCATMQDSAGQCKIVQDIAGQRGQSKRVHYRCKVQDSSG
jgi:hypothetical protein